MLPSAPVRLGAALAFVVALLPLEAGAQPVVENAPPAQWILTSGTVVVGTQVSEDAEFYTVQTSQGLVRIRKTDLARIDLHGASQPVVSSSPAIASSAPPAPVPAPRVEDDDGGGTLFLEGLGCFALSYGITALVGALVALADDDGNLLFIPVAGPILFGDAQGVASNDWVYLVIDSVLQGAGIVAMIAGLATWGAGGEARLHAAPWYASGAGGIAVGGTL